MEGQEGKQDSCESGDYLERKENTGSDSRSTGADRWLAVPKRDLAGVGWGQLPSPGATLHTILAIPADHTVHKPSLPHRNGPDACTPTGSLASCRNPWLWAIPCIREALSPLTPEFGSTSTL